MHINCTRGIWSCILGADGGFFKGGGLALHAKKRKGVGGGAAWGLMFKARPMDTLPDSFVVQCPLLYLSYGSLILFWPFLIAASDSIPPLKSVIWVYINDEIYNSSNCDYDIQ